MHVVIIDKTTRVAQAARRALPQTDLTTTLVDSPHELPVVFKTRGFPDLMIVCVTDDLTSWEIATRLQYAGYQGRLLAFVDGDSADSRIRPLTQLSNVECVVLPTSPTLLEAALRKATAGRAGIDQIDSSSAPALSEHHGIIGASPQMRNVFARIDKVAGGDVNVCIHGESGTGKELIARAIHYASPRRDRPLITLDCTTIPEGLMESHLFGHVKGAFTGATGHREGVFSLAHTGTLFIDELGELSPPLQAKLLRVIQTREFCKVGGAKPIRTDIRLITATHTDLIAAVAQGTFREDLYYRVAVFMIKVPPLRERVDDIPLLVNHFLKKFSAAYGKPLMNVAPATMERMIALPWPGNVRQLENFLEQAVVLAEGDTLVERDLFAGELSSTMSAGANPAPPGLQFEPGLPLAEVERRHVLRTLQKVHGNRMEAARLLQISVRGLQYKLKTYSRQIDVASGARRASSRGGASGNGALPNQTGMSLG